MWKAGAVLGLDGPFCGGLKQYFEQRAREGYPCQFISP